MPLCYCTLFRDKSYWTCLSGSRNKLYNMLCYLLALVLLEEVSSVMNYNLRLIFRTGDKSTKENISPACDGVFIREHYQDGFVPSRKRLSRPAHLGRSWIVRANGHEQ